ncbi:MAG: LacI family DNA-binding transcriptional regulator [Clostridia bacterium]|nr:LacI family DNA-binding transcriptional regulator [Clostridia bacterium]
MEKITIVSMAKELGIAPSTVSRAFDPSSRISEPVREKILKYAESVGYVPNRAAARLSMGQLKVGVAISNSYEYGANELLRGIRDAFRSLQDYKLSLKVVLFDNVKNLKDGYASLMEELSDCECLILSGLSASASRVINPIAKNIPVVMIQSYVEGVDALFNSTIDASGAAVMAADLLALSLRDRPQKRVALFTGSRSNVTHSSAASSFAHACKELGMELVFSFDMQDSEDVLARACADMPEADGIYITSGKSLSLCRKVEKIKNRPALVTFDIYPELGEYLKNGVICASIYQDMYHQSYNAFTLLVRYILDRTAPPQTYSPVPQAVFASTLSYYLPPEPDLSDMDIIYM